MNILFEITTHINSSTKNKKSDVLKMIRNQTYACIIDVMQKTLTSNKSSIDLSLIVFVYCILYIDLLELSKFRI